MMNPSLLNFFMNGQQQPQTQAPQQDMVQGILSARFQPQDLQPGLGDYSSAIAKSYNFQPTQGADVAQGRAANVLKVLSDINTMNRTNLMMMGGPTGALIDRFMGATGTNFPTALSSVKSPIQGGTMENGQITPIPGAAPTAAGMTGAKTTAEKTAEINVERQANVAKAQSALVGFKQQSDLVTKTIDDAISKISPYSTGYGAFLSNLPETQAGALQNDLATIKANVGFDKLQQMRDNSKTGGALGQVSDFENKLLQAVNGALDPKQSGQLKQNLEIIKNLYPKVYEERKRAFEYDYGQFGGEAPPSSPDVLGTPGGDVPLTMPNGLPPGITDADVAEYKRLKGIP